MPRTRVNSVLAFVAGAVLLTGPLVLPVTDATSLWPEDAVPAVASANDGHSVEVGVRFFATRPGVITGIRFFKGSGNTGIHTGSLWTTDGKQIASVTFQNESDSGWQSADLPKPVAVTPGQTYVASYFAPHGHYSVDYPYFDVARAANGLVAPSNGTRSVNGVYQFSPTSAFPRDGFGANYWVDVTYRSAVPFAADHTVTIMPLGDSITEGVGAPGGYRTSLWSLLEDSGASQLEFVGSATDGPAHFVDAHHEGHIGWGIDEVSGHITDWLRSTRADIILLHIGTNDINRNATGQEAEIRLRLLLDRIFAVCPQVRVVISTLIPLRTGHHEAWVDFNSAIPSIVAQERARGHAISMVDMANILDPATDYADALHPNQLGYDKMAAAWFPSARAAYDAEAR